jgi:hypothetical protein
MKYLLSSLLTLCALSLPVAAAPPAEVALQFGAEVPAHVQARVKSLLSPLASVTELPAEGCPALPLCQEEKPQRLILAVGQVPLAKPATNLLPEGFSLQTTQHTYGRVLSVQGRATTLKGFSNVNNGLLYGLYAALEGMGFRFLHPLAPTAPAQLVMPDLHLQESPHWPRRGFAHHTMHPLELAHVLNGWGPQGPEDAAGFAALLPEWERYLEWLTANRQNMVQWVLLEKDHWRAFSRSPERQQRLKQLTERAQAWGLRVGVDAPLALTQQNAWRLIEHYGNPQEESRQIRANLDWLMGARFDFISTEAGLSEFHHPEPAHMLAWIDEATAYLDDKYGVEFWAKIHTSTGQEIEQYRDPETGGPLNFNFLPYYADRRLGVLPHTVQIYGLDDPAPTYGREDFKEIGRYLALEAGRRPVMWFPETSYWVTYDINVPLFLPVYAGRRLSDLQLLDRLEQRGKLGRGAQAGSRMDGQLIFTSGWEWGYWLNDVISARAAWNPRISLETGFADALAPLGNPEAARLLNQIQAEQGALLVEGQVEGQAPENIVQRSGMAYLPGVDTWTQMGHVLRRFGLKGFQTQPDQLPLLTVRNEAAAAQRYRREIAPLLEAMRTGLRRHAERWDALSHAIAAPGRNLHAEISDGLWMNALRAEQLYQSYEYAARLEAKLPETARINRTAALAAIDQAQRIVQRREKAYRADPERLAGWGPNPTAYTYGYLWHARHLFFWRRDILSLDQNLTIPCALNVIDPLLIALPDGQQGGLATLARAVTWPLGPLSRCFHIPGPEPVAELQLTP